MFTRFSVWATLICSTAFIIGWTWFRSRRREAKQIDYSVPPSMPPDPTQQSEEVREKPELCADSTSTTTQHLQHEGTDVYVISSLSECEEILSSIPRSNLSLLGFDCEWSQPYHLSEIMHTARGSMLSAFIYPVALVQIATTDSRCYLIRLSEMDNQIPKSLVDIMEDEKCLKFGVGSLNDLNRLKNHYFIHPRGSVDLRHLAHDRVLGQRIGLQGLSNHFLGIDLNKDALLQCSNWQCPNLSIEQIIYASMDAKVSLNILLSIFQIICRERSIPQTVHCYGLSLPSGLVDLIFDICDPFIDVPFAGQTRNSHQIQPHYAGSIASVRTRNRIRNRNRNGRVRLPLKTNINTVLT